MHIDSAATVLRVANLERSKRFYLNVLGFDLDVEFGQYLGLKPESTSW